MVMPAPEGTASAPNGLDQQPLTDAERTDAETKVMVPESHTYPWTLAGKAVLFHPLVIKQSKLLNAKCIPAIDALKKAGDDLVALMQSTDVIGTALADAYGYLCQVYGITGIDRDWIEDNLTAEQLQEALEVQMALQRNNDFLGACLRATLNVAATVNAGARASALKETMDRAEQVMAAAKLASIRVSATPGTALSPSSSSGTPVAS